MTVRTWFTTCWGLTEDVICVAENHVLEREWLLLSSKITWWWTWFYTDVSNTALILAVRWLNVNQLLCPEWVSEWRSATFSTVRERESHPHWQFSVCSRFANHERITVLTWITSSQFSVCRRVSDSQILQMCINVRVLYALFYIMYSLVKTEHYVHAFPACLNVWLLNMFYCTEMKTRNILIE